MSLPGIIALLSGALGVWLTIRQSIWCWPLALISVVASTIEFYRERLFGDMVLQVFYFFLGIYGWIYWKQNQKKDFAVERTPVNKFLPLLLATIVQSFLYYYLLVYFRGDRPLFDSILAAASISATYMMTKKWAENWMAWVMIDGAYILLYGVKEMWLFALLYALFTGMAFYGWLTWRKAIS